MNEYGAECPVEYTRRNNTHSLARSRSAGDESVPAGPFEIIDVLFYLFVLRGRSATV